MVKTYQKVLISVLLVSFFAGFFGGPIFDSWTLFSGGLGTTLVCIVTLMLGLIWAKDEA